MELYPTFLFPETLKLTPQLEKILNKAHTPLHMVELVDRKPFDYSSTFPAEIICCRMNDGQLISLFCKYSNHTRYSHGHRGGVEYEAKIYKEILYQIPLSSVPFYGICMDENKQTCLVIEYLSESELLKDTPRLRHFANAASWIGNMHKMYDSNTPKGIKIYDTSYYLIWLNEVEKLLDSLKEKYPWLPAVCRYFKDNLQLISTSTKTLIHGEYYPKNILVKDGVIYPIDWESAAIGPGEIDLASLIEGWDAERKNIAIKSYIKARWPDGNFSESEFEKKLWLVNIYFFLRWTGEHDDPEFWLSRTNWFNQFYQLAKEAGFT